MQGHPLTKLAGRIEKGQTISSPFYTKGADIGFVGVPSEIESTELNFEASLDGTTWFPVLGQSFQVLRTGSYSQPATITPSETIIKIGRDTFQGFQLLRVVGNRAESAGRIVNLYALD
jgi:hypothetical protein